MIFYKSYLNVKNLIIKKWAILTPMILWKYLVKIIQNIVFERVLHVFCYFK